MEISVTFTLYRVGPYVDCLSAEIDSFRVTLTAQFAVCTQ